MMRADGIRVLLHALIDLAFDPGAVVVDEYGIGGNVSDVAVFATNGLHLFEIKSDADSTRRLASQARCYSTYAVRATLVAGEKLFGKAATMVPDWWGLVLASADHLAVVRQPRPNPSLDVKCIVAPLWGGEAWREVQERGWARGLSRCGGHTWRGILCEKLERDELHRVVHAHVARRQWFARKALKVRSVAARVAA